MAQSVSAGNDWWKEDAPTEMQWWANDAIAEQKAMGISRDRQDQILQMLSEAPDMAASEDRQKQMLGMVDEDQAAQKAVFEQLMSPADTEMQEAIESPLMARSRREQESYLAQLDEERSHQAALFKSMIEKNRQHVVDVQNSEEASLMRASRERQDKIIGQIMQRRKAKAEAAARVKALTSAEQRLRSVAKEELSIGAEAAKARDARDRKAYDAATKRLEPLFQERSRLLDAVRKINPKKADALYDELYLDR